MRSRSAAALAAFLLATTVPLSSTSAAPGTQPGAVPKVVRIASLFGESDEEKAARQHETDQDTQIAELKRRVHDLEQALEQSNGQNEQLAHRIQELSERLDRQQKDFDYKLCALAAQQLGTTPDQSGGGLPCDTVAAMATLTSPGGQGQGAVAPPAAPAPNGSSHAQYDEAMNLLARARYDEARAAFRAFADANPKDNLTPQALYWAGNVAYVQKDYSGAAQTFLEQLKKFPTSPQGAESMLKLGQSLLALGQKKEGCTTLGAIKSKFKQAPPNVLSQAATLRATSCKGQ